MTEPAGARGADFTERYHIDRELAEGGMATVYVAEDVRHGRKVAIKVIRPDVAAGLGTDRFLAEIKLTASLQHPHILGLIDSGVIATAERGERLFYVMPYVAGETLRGRLAREGALPVRDAASLLAEVADALACAHGHGVIHRDIKPENILLGHGHAMVTDFGVAKALHRSLTDRSITSSGMSIGTPAYMAPEQAVGDPNVNHKADLYALGVVLYEALTGHTPFAGPDLANMVAAALTRPAPSVSTVLPTCPASLVALVAALLERDPARRPESAAEVRDALRSSVVGVPASAPYAPPTARTRRVRFRAGIAIAVLLIAGLAVARQWRAWYTSARPASVARTPRSIAVLPFENLNGDSASDYLGDGIAEELIVELGRRLPGVRVASRTSTFAMKGRGTNVGEVGKRLRVDAVLESSVRRENDRIRVTTRLVDVGRDSVLWAEEYNSQLRSMLSVQDSMAHNIVRALRGALGGESGGVEARSWIPDVDAYQDYLRGRRYLGLRQPGAMTSAIASFNAAISRDSTFALAYAGLAHAYSLAAPFESRAPHTVFPLARIAAERALALDSAVAEAHTALGMVSMFYDWDWPAAGRHLKRGVELNSSYAEGHLFYAWYHLFRGQLLSADGEISEAYLLDPLSVVIATRRGAILQYRGRDADAIPYFRHALEIDSTFFYARAALAVAFLRTGQRDSARRFVPRNEVHPGTAESAFPSWVLVQLGDTAGARRQLRTLQDLGRRSYVSGDGLAGVLAVLGDTARALDLLAGAERERAFTLPWLPRLPMFDAIRGSERYRRLIRRVGVVPP
jgi:serine/threonine-protein kinase